MDGASWPKICSNVHAGSVLSVLNYERSIQSTTKGAGHPTLAHSNNFCTTFSVVILKPFNLNALHLAE